MNKIPFLESADHEKGDSTNIFSFPSQELPDSSGIEQDIDITPKLEPMTSVFTTELSRIDSSSPIHHLLPGNHSFLFTDSSLLGFQSFSSDNSTFDPINPRVDISSNIEMLLSSLSPVPLLEIPLHMVSTPPPDFSSIIPPLPPPSPLPINIVQEEDDMLESWSSTVDIPLYAYPGPDWEKLANQIESSTPEHSWVEESNSLPLFESALDLDPLIDLQ